MAIDILNLSAAELDELIAAAAARRATLLPEVPHELPKHLTGILDPQWFANLQGENTVLQLRHVGHGWVAFGFPPHERAHILTLLLHHALLPKKLVNEPAESAPVSGGGKLH